MYVAVTASSKYHVDVDFVDVCNMWIMELWRQASMYMQVVEYMWKADKIIRIRDICSRLDLSLGQSHSQHYLEYYLFHY